MKTSWFKLVRCGLCASLFFLPYLLKAQAAAAPQGTDAAAPADKPAPDVLIFTNGDRLTGKLERATGGNVVFKSDMAGELTIPFAKVKELHSGSEFVALSKGKPGEDRPEATGSVSFADGELALTPKGGQPQSIPAKDLGVLIDVPLYAKEVDHHAGFREGWTGSATAGFTLVRSTTSSTTATGALNFVRAIPTVGYLPKRNRTTIDVTESYGNSSTPVIPPPAPPAVGLPAVVQTDIFHADGERDHYLDERRYFLADVSFDHDFSQGLQLQQVYGAGFGWTVAQSDLAEFDLKAELHYERQQFLVATNNAEIFGATLQENYRRTLPLKAVFTEWVNILPAFNDVHDYSANAYLSLAVPVFKRLGVSLSSTDNYLNNPEQYYRRNSVQVVTGLTYAFK